MSKNVQVQGTQVRVKESTGNGGYRITKVECGTRSAAESYARQAKK